MGFEETEGWDDFVAAVRKDTVQGIADSAFVLNLVPGDDDVDVKFAVELGLTILADKPLVLLAMPGRQIPPGLERVAHAVIQLDNDLDTEAGRAEVDAKLTKVVASLGLGDDEK